MHERFVTIDETKLASVAANHLTLQLLCILSILLNIAYSAPNTKQVFVKLIKLSFWNNLPQRFFDLVKSSTFYGSSKYVKMPPSWLATEG